MAAVATLLASCGRTEAPVQSAQVDWIAEATGRGEVFSEERAAEVYVADCMREAGFEYEPIEFPRRDRDESLTSREYREQWGFGITTAAPQRDDIHTSSGENPNQQYLESLNQTGQTAYAARLNDPETGCLVVASDRIRESTMEFMRTLPGEIRDLVDGYNSGSAEVLVDAERDWSACMADRGYDFAHRTMMFDAINALIPEDETDPDDDAQSSEIEIALADFDCAASTIEPAKDELLREIYTTAERYVIELPEWLGNA